MYTDRVLAAPPAIVQNVLDKRLRTPKDISEGLRMLEVPHWDFTMKPKLGYIILHEVYLPIKRRYYQTAWDIKFPFHSIIPVSKFNWSDEKSLASNNSSGQNMRLIDDGSGRWSLHAIGCADDTNPQQNPCLIFDKAGIESERLPPSGAYDPDAPGTLHGDHILVKQMENEGVDWGGRWISLFDPQHFQMNRDMLPAHLAAYVK